MRLLSRRFSFFSTIRQKIKQQRQTRLGKVGEAVLPTKAVQSLALIRNIGIIAHIDAGKTTTTQRMLYYAGALPSPGDIDQGTTTMDYMKQERQRGITIRSAAISFNWNKCQINLIDTPGHVDFSGQVARSLRVLDGAITILDGVKGVEAQTVKVWEMAGKKNIPRICFINKLDRIGSSIQRTAQAIQNHLKIKTLLMQIPIGQGQNFKGIVDLINLKKVMFGGKYGQKIIQQPLSQNDSLYDQAIKKRNMMIQTIANYDQNVGQLYLNQQKIPNGILKAGLRRILCNTQLQSKITPLYLGAAYKNQGVQPLLDSIVDYLPSPSQRPPVISTLDPAVQRKPLKTQIFSGYTFKVIYDKQLGPLTYTRVYSGQLKKNTQIYNVSRDIYEKPLIYRVRANQYVPVNEVSAGDIVALSGLRQSRAGQTLTNIGDNTFLLQKLQLPTPIFSQPLQLNTKTIRKIVLQDNSLLFKQQVETNQYLLSGLGQLHLQIVKDKLIQQGIDVKLGKLKIGYRETINQKITKKLKQRVNLKNDNYQQFELQLQIVPLRLQNGQLQDKVNTSFTFPKVQNFDLNWREFINKKIGINHNKQQDQTKQSVALRSKIIKRSSRNPTPVQPLNQYVQQQDNQVQNQQSQNQNNQKQDQEQQLYYHINTLPFQTLYQLIEQCKVAMLSGNNGYPLMGVQLRIVNGKYKKKHFSKVLMNKTASQLVRSMLSSSMLVEPVLQFSLKGEQVMINQVSKDIIKKRGRIQEQLQTSIKGYIPAASVKGWIKQLRVMGFQVDMKFSNYEQVMGIDAKKLIDQNR